jgi:hypothetical protein
MGHTVAQTWTELSDENGVLTMVTKFDSPWAHADRCKFYIYLRSLIVRHF